MCAIVVSQPESTRESFAPGRTEIYPNGGASGVGHHRCPGTGRKREQAVLLDFGGNWCGDCQVLEMYFHDATNRPLLDSHYILVPVNIGRFDQNLGIAARYGVPLNKGVPALAVLAPDGQLVYSQRHGEFEAIRTMDSASVTAFLQQWKG